MGIDETDITRLLAGDVPSEDAQLGQVSAFLGDLKAAYPPSSVSALEDRHLAVVAREVRAVGASRLRDQRDAQRSRIRLRRTVAAFGAGLLAVLTAGVGVASAMGLDPLELLPGVVAKPSATPDASARTPGSSDAPGNGQQASHATRTRPTDPSVPPPTTGGPGASASATPAVTDAPAAADTPAPEASAAPAPEVSPTPSPSASATHGTKGNCGNGKGAGKARCTKGNSGKDDPGSSASSVGAGSVVDASADATTSSPSTGTGKEKDKAKGRSKENDTEAGVTTQS